MSKINKYGMLFDSELEVKYYEYVKDKCVYVIYHPKPIQVTRGNMYTPDFLIWWGDHIEIVETKGYNPYSKMRDDMIHQVMLAKTEDELRLYLELNGYNTQGATIQYKKIKHLKAYGFVDWDFKNPNTIANKRKTKIGEQRLEIADLKDFKKDADRYYSYLRKIKNNEKLTKQQKAWFDNYEKEVVYMEV